MSLLDALKEAEWLKFFETTFCNPNMLVIGKLKVYLLLLDVAAVIDRMEICNRLQCQLLAVPQNVWMVAIKISARRNLYPNELMNWNEWWCKMNSEWHNEEIYTNYARVIMHASVVDGVHSRIRPAWRHPHVEEDVSFSRSTLEGIQLFWPGVHPFQGHT